MAAESVDCSSGHNSNMNNIFQCDNSTKNYESQRPLLELHSQMVPNCDFNRLSSNINNISEKFSKNDSSNHINSLLTDENLPNHNDGSHFEFLNNNSPLPNVLSSQHSPVMHFPYSTSELMLPYSAAQNDNSNNYSPLNPIQDIPEELHIRIDTDDDNCHSWRPNNVIGSLSSDFFMLPTKPIPPSLQSRTLHQDLNIKSEFQENQDTESIKKIFPNNLLPENVLRSSYFGNENFLTTSPQEHIKKQKAQLNNLRYEIINMKQQSMQIRDDITLLTQKLKEKNESQNILGIQRLATENSQLRLECQCLFMEVDYYMTAHGNSGDNCNSRDGNHRPDLKPNNSDDNCNSRDDPRPDLRPSEMPEDRNEMESQDYEESNKWDCPSCTFKNHPAINSCEMCQTPHVPRASQIPISNSCFCLNHQKAESASS